MDKYYSDLTSKYAFKCGTLKARLEILVKKIAILSDNEYLISEAKEALKVLETLDAEAEKYVETLNKKVAEM